MYSEPGNDAVLMLPWYSASHTIRRKFMVSTPVAALHWSVGGRHYPPLNGSKDQIASDDSSETASSCKLIPSRGLAALRLNRTAKVGGFMEKQAAKEAKKSLDYIKGYFEGICDSRQTVVNDLRKIVDKLEEPTSKAGFEAEGKNDDYRVK